FAACSSISRRRPASTTRYPSASRARAAALPMPVHAPVITATRPLGLMCPSREKGAQQGPDREVREERVEGPAGPEGQLSPGRRAHRPRQEAAVDEEDLDGADRQDQARHVGEDGEEPEWRGGPYGQCTPQG